jgi:uncharacterized protein YdhG (YjbR/CyaY superfamily)
MGLKPRAASKKPTTHAAYIAKVPDERREDIARLREIVIDVAPELEPTMAYGMMGFGPIHYKYASGREGDWFKIGIANQKRYISLYCCAADEQGYVAERYRARLPGADIGKSCVRFKRLSDLDEETLRELIRDSVNAGWGM